MDATPKARPGRVLGIDPGTVRVGVAISDPDRLVATGHTVVPGGEDAPAAIAKIAQEQHVSAIVVGCGLCLRWTRCGYRRYYAAH